MAMLYRAAHQDGLPVHGLANNYPQMFSSIFLKAQPDGVKMRDKGGVPQQLCH